MKKSPCIVLVLAGAASAQLFPTQQVATAAEPVAMAVSDLDGDGLADAALAANAAQAIVVHRGDGRLGLLPAETVAGAGDIVSVQAGDIDGDGWPDLVGGANADNKLVYVHALGGGAFGAPALMGGAKLPGGVALADLDGDGDLEAVVATSTTFSAALYDNQSGVLQTPPLHVGGFGAWTDIAAADFDGDGHADLAEVATDGRVQLLLGDGLGGVGAALPQTQLSPASFRLAVGDLDHDGHPDLLACGGDLVVMLNQGGAGLGAPTLVDVANGSAVSVDVADLDADGQADVAVGSSSGRVETFLGDGHGGLVSHAKLLVGGAAKALKLRDANGDGRIDAFVANASGDQLMVRGGDGAGGFAGPEVMPTAGLGQGLVAAGDANGDGRPDLAVSWSASQTTEILLADASGQLSVAATLPGGPSPSGVDVVDVDGDGDTDVLVSDWEQGILRLHRATSPMVFAAPLTIAPGAGEPGAVIVADLGLGGAGPDLVLRCSSPLKLQLIMDDGAGGYLAPTSIPAPNTFTPATAVDMDLDGDLDLVGANAFPLSATVLLHAGGSFTPSSTAIPDLGSMAVGDLDEDGLPDAVVAGLDGPLAVLRGTPSGAFAAPAVSTLDFEPVQAQLADLDGDGHLDLVLADPGTSTLQVLVGDGHAGLAVPEAYGFLSASVALADFDLDGRTDAAAALSHTGVAVLRGAAPSPWTALGHGLAGTLGTPTLLPTGTLVGGAPVSIALGSARPNSSAALVLGLSVLGLPFKGGTLVPQPDLLLPGLPTGPAGAITLQGTLPAGLPSGLQIVLQWWVVDPAAPKGLSASVGVSGLLP